LYKIYNIGNENPVELLRFIEIIEATVGKKAKAIMKPIQPGDVVSTYADISNLRQDTGFSPITLIEHGLEQFIDWYKAYYTKENIFYN
jgi:UDP-glucuronate 4-epimerase